jgi:hypothetical protein
MHYTTPLSSPKDVPVTTARFGDVSAEFHSATERL